MDYLTSIVSAVIMFPIIAFLITIPFILYNYHKYGAIYYFRVLIIYSFILYLLVSYFLVIMPLPNISEINMQADSYQLIPFTFIIDFIRESGFDISKTNTYLNAITSSYVYVPLFNIIMFIPFGLYLRYYFNCSLKQTILFSFLLSLFYELTQLTGLYYIYPHSYRLFDIDDLMLNTVGGIIGFYSLNLFKKILPTKKEITENSNKISLKISILKRMTLFFLDLFIWAVFYFATSFLFNLPIFSLIIYYLFIPFLTKGKTIAGLFMHITITGKKENLKLKLIIIRNILFIIIYFYLFYFNLLGFIVFNFNYIYFIIKGEFIYETFSNTKLQSTFIFKTNE